MDDAMLARSGPLAGRRSATVSGLAPALRFSFRGGDAARLKLGAAFGATPSVETCRAVEAQGRAALWLGPDEWLLLAAVDDADHLAQSLTDALAGEPHSLVDVSHRNTGFTIEGDGAADLLNEGCPLDLDRTAFPVGMCTRTVLAKSDVVLWRSTSTRFHLECWRSFAPYVRSFLDQAAENQR